SSGALLSSDAGLRVVTVGSLLEAERSAPKVRPRVLVWALGDPSSEHPEQLGAFCKVFKAISVLIISNPAPERIVTGLIKAGAGGYLLTDELPKLPSAIRELADGGAPMSLPVSRIMLARARRSSTQMPAALPLPSRRTATLTARQLQILELLAGGHSYDDIGLALTLSVNTVRWHVKELYERLGAKTKVEAVMIGVELRLLNNNLAPPKA
ncbi:MAG TPA: response regulator transcription factor, partial [Polyangiaceae bacterium]